MKRGVGTRVTSPLPAPAEAYRAAPRRTPAAEGVRLRRAPYAARSDKWSWRLSYKGGKDLLPFSLAFVQPHYCTFWGIALWSLVFSGSDPF